MTDDPTIEDRFTISSSTPRSAATLVADIAWIGSALASLAVLCLFLVGQVSQTNADRAIAGLIVLGTVSWIVRRGMG